MDIATRRRHPSFVTLLGACLVVAGCATAAPHPSTAPAPAATPQTSTTRPAPPATPTPSARAPATPAADLARRIDNYISQDRFATASWGISVVSLRSGDPIYGHQADKLAIPASNAKLYTAALALSALGTGHRFRTTLYATAAPRRGSIQGNLILYGRGDPTLGKGNDRQTPHAWAEDMAKTLARRGVRHVTGALVADDTYFSGPDIPLGWEARDLQSWFSPPVSALTVQGNMFALRVGPNRGLCCNVSTTPAMPGMDIVNLTQTDPNAGYADLGIYRAPGSSRLQVYGAMRPTAKTRRFALSAPDPARMAGELLHEALVRHGIKVDGGVRSLHWPHRNEQLGAPGTVKIAEVRSPRLDDIVQHALKHSDNLYAQLLLLAAGVHMEAGGTCPDRNGAPRTTADWSLCAMRDMLRKAGIGRDEADLEEGSGLSRKDLVTPLATTKLLAWAAGQPFAATYHDALPIAGHDGTLIRRMRNTAAADNLHAKTGTLRHSYTLSGYVTAASGEKLAFSLMLDDYVRPTTSTGQRTGPSPQHDLDAIATMLADYGGSP